MAKLTIDDLKRIKEKSSKENSLRTGPSRVKVTVHMGTCGIAAGARAVMDALMDELAGSDRDDIRVVNSGCQGMCNEVVGGNCIVADVGRSRDSRDANHCCRMDYGVQRRRERPGARCQIGGCWAN